MSLYHDRLRTVGELAEDGLIEAALTFFSSWLEDLEITVQEAAIYFHIDYESLKCRYTDLVIPTIGKKVAATNAKKYDKLVDIYKAQYDPLVNYDRSEESTHIRTPQLTTGTQTAATSSTTNSSTTLSENKQTHTQTTQPNNYQTSTVKSVAPFDTANFKPQEQSVATNTGSLTVTDSYQGDPDSVGTTGSASNTSSASTTTQETGTETTGIQSHVVGNIGVTTSQQMAEAEIALAQKMAIFREIEKDLAQQLLLQVWF